MRLFEIGNADMYHPLNNISDFSSFAITYTQKVSAINQGLQTLILKLYQELHFVIQKIDAK